MSYGLHAFLPDPGSLQLWLPLCILTHGTLPHTHLIRNAGVLFVSICMSVICPGSLSTAVALESFFTVAQRREEIGHPAVILCIHSLPSSVGYTPSLLPLALVQVTDPSSHGSSGSLARGGELRLHRCCRKSGPVCFHWYTGSSRGRLEA